MQIEYVLSVDEVLNAVRKHLEPGVPKGYSIYGSIATQVLMMDGRFAGVRVYATQVKDSGEK